jgi:hypothetical protein
VRQQVMSARYRTILCLGFVRFHPTGVDASNVTLKADVQFLISTLCLIFLRVGVQFSFKWTPTLMARGLWISIPLLSPPFIVVTVNQINVIAVVTYLKWSQFSDLLHCCHVPTLFTWDSYNNLYCDSVIDCLLSKSKGKGHPRTGHEGPDGE